MAEGEDDAGADKFEKQDKVMTNNLHKVASDWWETRTGCTTGDRRLCIILQIRTQLCYNKLNGPKVLPLQAITSSDPESRLRPLGFFGFYLINCMIFLR